MEKEKIGFWTKLLIALGYLSKCCHEPTHYHEGWGHLYCTGCEKRV